MRARQTFLTDFSLWQTELNSAGTTTITKSQGRGTSCQEGWGLVCPCHVLLSIPSA